MLYIIVHYYKEVNTYLIYNTHSVLYQEVQIRASAGTVFNLQHAVLNLFRLDAKRHQHFNLSIASHFSNIHKMEVGGFTNVFLSDLGQRWHQGFLQ